MPIPIFEKVIKYNGIFGCFNEKGLMSINDQYIITVC